MSIILFFSFFLFFFPFFSFFFFQPHRSRVRSKSISFDLISSLLAYAPHLRPRRLCPPRPYALPHSLPACGFVPCRCGHTLSRLRGQPSSRRPLVLAWPLHLRAAVFGAAKVLGQIKPPGVEVHFISAASENMISGSGMRPGDIVTASNGKTIEVDNTDAEGRLTLADALVYACNQGVDKIIDLATLTGAIRVALGPSIAGILTPSDELAEEFAAAYEVSGEKFWRLPMEESYWDYMESSIADMLAAGPLQSKAGAITAALFLKHFVDEKVKWMHIDIAGTVWSNKKRVGTGFGVTTLVEWVLNNSSS